MVATMTPSKEATKEQLQMATEQGNAFTNALNHMINEEAHGEEKQVGDYIIGYAVEEAEGMYQMQGGELVWYEPREENAHIEITVRDAADGRFIPGLEVRLTVLDAAENEIDSNVQPFIWHPWLYHYGRNWVLPGDGEYTFHVRVQAPDFMRHDKKNGQRFTESPEVDFNNVKIKTGQKKS